MVDRKKEKWLRLINSAELKSTQSGTVCICAVLNHHRIVTNTMVQKESRFAADGNHLKTSIQIWVIHMKMVLA